MAIALSLLDLVPVGDTIGASEALRAAIDLARRAEQLGYRRVWYAEHHNIPAVASSATAVLIGAAAATTARIRVGAGGVMLPNHSPLQVVETYRTLEALYPGRIDLGVGRAPGTDPLTSHALRRGGRHGDDVNAQLAELLAFEDAAFPSGHPFASIRAMPDDTTLPPIYMLGSTNAGALIAATLGVGYAFAGHFNLADADVAISRYRAEFRPGRLTEPYVILAVSAVAAEDDEQARGFAAVSGLTWLRMKSGKLERLPSVDEALAYPYAPAERALVDDYLVEQQIIGTPEKVRARIEQLAARTGADEIMVTTNIPIPAERLRSYERMARAFALDGAPR